MTDQELPRMRVSKGRVMHRVKPWIGTGLQSLCRTPGGKMARVRGAASDWTTERLGYPDCGQCSKQPAAPLDEHPVHAEEPGKPELLPAEPTVYTLNAHPDPAHINYRRCRVTVERHGDGRWAVCHYGYWFDTNGDSDYPAITSDRSDEWLATHLFDLDTALALARRVAPTLVEPPRRATQEG